MAQVSALVAVEIKSEVFVVDFNKQDPSHPGSDPKEGNETEEHVSLYGVIRLRALPSSSDTSIVIANRLNKFLPKEGAGGCHSLWLW